MWGNSFYEAGLFRAQCVKSVSFAEMKVWVTGSTSRVRMMAYGDARPGILPGYRLGAARSMNHTKFRNISLGGLLTRQEFDDLMKFSSPEKRPSGTDVASYIEYISQKKRPPEQREAMDELAADLYMASCGNGRTMATMKSRTDLDPSVGEMTDKLSEPSFFVTCASLCNELSLQVVPLQKLWSPDRVFHVKEERLQENKEGVLEGIDEFVEQVFHEMAERELDDVPSGSHRLVGYLKSKRNELARELGTMDVMKHVAESLYPSSEAILQWADLGIFSIGGLDKSGVARYGFRHPMHAMIAHAALEARWGGLTRRQRMELQYPTICGGQG